MIELTESKNKDGCIGGVLGAILGAGIGAGIGALCDNIGLGLMIGGILLITFHVFKNE
ncbi:MAG: hypothetical protein IJ943_00220 [Akkermansia sp.]|nr:hypothetical protein [Akkermansia sp.]